jgi:threonine dehydratase
LGIAYAAKHFGVPATIFVPCTVAQIKRDGMSALGAEIDSTQPHYDAAMEGAIAFRRRAWIDVRQSVHR